MPRGITRQTRITRSENVYKSKETSSSISEPTTSGDRLVKSFVPSSKMITSGLRYGFESTGLTSTPRFYMRLIMLKRPITKPVKTEINILTTLNLSPMTKKSFQQKAGKSQADPIAMTLYVLSIQPPMACLQTASTVK